MKSNIVKDKSYLFAKRIIDLNKFLCSEKKEFRLSDQIKRSGTAIGALVMEAIDAESKPDFIHKFSISLKEARETEYWLSLLHDSEYINDKQYASMNQDLDELNRLIVSIIKSAKDNL